MKKNKKGAITLYLLIIALIVSITTIMLYTAPTEEETKFVGSTQQKLLISQEIKNQAISFLDMAATLAKEKTIQDLNETSGFDESHFLEEFPCERAIYPVLNEKQEITCFPDYENTTKTRFKINFDKLIRQNPDVLFSPRDLEVTTTNTEKDIIININTINAVSIPIYQSFSNYYDEKIQNLIGSGIPRYSYDGQELIPIQNIPNVICDEKDTNFGKICAANQDLIDALKKLSKEYLVPENKKMIITQAYRTEAIQKALYDYACNTKGCEYGCNPDTSKGCPHMVAGAIDMNIIDENNRNLNSHNSPDETKQQVLNIMCEYGFVNYALESWHYEYGTRMWQTAMEKRERGDEACQYPFT